MMVEKKIVINLAQGLHARPASAFIKLAGSFESDVQIGKDGKLVNGKSILGILSMGIAKGQTVTVVTNGSDEDQAAAALEKFLVEGED